MARITLTRGYEATVDPEDLPKLSRWLWCATGKPPHVYAVRKADGRSLGMHRFLLGARTGEDVDHANGDTLDNRRSNLRVASRSQNTANSISVWGAIAIRGVTVDKRNGRFRAQIRNGGKSRSLGTYANACDAEAAYLHARREIYAEFAPLRSSV